MLFIDIEETNIEIIYVFWLTGKRMSDVYLTCYVRKKKYKLTVGTEALAVNCYKPYFFCA